MINIYRYLKLFLTASVISIVFIPSLFAQYNVRVKFPFTVSDNGGTGKVLRFGFSPDATSCIDDYNIGFAQCDSVHEAELPPLPPSGNFDARFANIHGDCLGQGVVQNIHHSDSVNQVDTFRVNFHPGASGFPMHFNWYAGLGDFCDSMVLYKGTTKSVANFLANMTTQTGALLTDEEVSKVTIFVYGLRGSQTAPPTPALILPADADTGLAGSTILKWNSVSPSFNYRLQYSTDSTFSVNVTSSELFDTLKQISGLVVNTTYYWRVKAIDALEGCYQDPPFSFTTASLFDTIKVTQRAHGTISPGTTVLANGDSLSFSINPATGYHIDSVLVDGVNVGAVSNYDFTNVTTTHTLTAYFSINTYTLSVSGDHGVVSRNPDQALYDYGTIVQVTQTPDSGYLFTGWSGDASGADEPLILEMFADKVVQANYVDARLVATYRTASASDWALATNTFGKLTSNKKKFDKVFFKFNLIADSTGILTLDFGGVKCDGIITKGKTKLDTLGSFTSAKKINLTLSGLAQGDTVQIDGIGAAGKLMKAKYFWGVKGKIKNVTSYKRNQPGLPMPNLHNVGEELFKQGAFPTGLLVGIPQGAKGAHSVINKKYMDVQKSFVKIVKKVPVLHSDTLAARCLDSLDGKKKKDMSSQQKSLPPDKQNNKLFAEVLALKMNVQSSVYEKFPAGLGELTFFNTSDSSNPFNGQMVSDIVTEADTMLTCLSLTSPSGATLEDLYETVKLINAEFGGDVDTVSFGTKTKLTGVKELQDAVNLRFTEGMSPKIAVSGEFLSGNTPERFSLEQNYPNPFNPTTTLSFTIGKEGFVTLKVYDMLGREVSTVLNHQEMDGGDYQFDFDGGNLSSGVYLYRLTVETINEGVTNQSFTSVKRMVLMK